MKIVKYKRSFSLLEVVLAVIVGSFVITGLIQFFNIGINVRSLYINNKVILQQARLIENFLYSGLGNIPAPFWEYPPLAEAKRVEFVDSRMFRYRGFNTNYWYYVYIVGASYPGGYTGILYVRGRRRVGWVWIWGPTYPIGCIPSSNYRIANYNFTVLNNRGVYLRGTLFKDENLNGRLDQQEPHIDFEFRVVGKSSD